MSDDSFDDGLVHSHGWATDKAGPVLAAAPTTVPVDPGYDDGLVHSHDWARGDLRTA